MKVWATLQRLGVDGVGCLYEQLAELAASLSRELRANPANWVIHEPECNILAWVPDAFHNAGAQAHREAVARERGAWITATTLRGESVLRATFMIPRTSRQSIRQLVVG